MLINNMLINNEPAYERPAYDGPRMGRAPDNGPRLRRALITIAEGVSVAQALVTQSRSVAVVVAGIRTIDFCGDSHVLAFVAVVFFVAGDSFGRALCFRNG